MKIPEFSLNSLCQNLIIIAIVILKVHFSICIFSISAIPIPHPVIVKVPQEIRIPIPQPYQVPVEISQPYPVEVIKHVEIPVEKPEPYVVEKHVSLD